MSTRETGTRANGTQTPAAHLPEGSCSPVAPSPTLLRRVREAQRTLRSAGTPAPALLSFRLPNRPGLNDGTIIPPDRFPLGTPGRQITRAAADRAPLRGTLRIVIVLVEFPDKKLSHDAAHFRQLFFSTGELPNGSVKEYYNEVAHGLIDLEGEVVGPYTLPKKMVDYAHGESGMGATQPNAQAMARDAATAADPDVNFGPYDNDGNGFVDAFIVIHAGSGAEETGLGTDIWSHKWTLSGGEINTDGTSIFGYLTVPEDCKIGVCAHELGHLLFGWPDLYDTDSSSAGLGDWCLMAGGSWNGTGDIPAHPSAWCKAQQGWVLSVNVKTTRTVKVWDVKHKQKVYRLWYGGTKGTEYFLAENRQKTGYDRELPEGGLLVFHIDDSIDTNADETHYKVGLVQADGLAELESGSSQGDGGDPYPGSSSNTEFSGTSTPNSHSYAGLDTHVSIRNIPASAKSMAVQVSVGVQDPTLQNGSTGPAVARLQQALTNLGFDPGGIDSIFGPETDAAVRAYQGARGLTVDGMVGPKTWAAIHADGQ